jgi:glucose/arabinose dehydrogenase
LHRFGAALALLLVSGLATAALALPLSQIKLPPGFRIELFAEVPNARQMALGRNTLFVGSMRAGKVYAIPLVSGRAGKPQVIAEGLNMPVGVAFRNGDLYVSAVSRILRFRAIESRLANPPRLEVVTARYPRDTHHGWKFIAFRTRRQLYVPVGAPCNICAPDPRTLCCDHPSRRRQRQVRDRGARVRNSVGFDWHPLSGELWFTDNGRDWLGDDAPPDELNRLDRPGRHFGYPYCHGGTIVDPEFGQSRRCAEFVPPVQNLGAHVAGLGMRFYGGRQFPERYRNAVFIAEHGSWNRSKKSGYRISVVRLDNNRAVAYEDFASGWLQGESAWGRPADVLVMADGSLLVSDDHAGAIYRISYRGD